MLIANGYDVKALVLSHKPSTSRKKRPLEVVAVAEDAGIPIVYVETMPALLQQLKELNARVGVLAAFGRIIPQSIIDVFPHGIVNIHPSRLPHYRGSTPIEQTILDGVSTTAVSIMGLVSEMDAGPLYAQAEFEVPSGVTKAALTEKLTRVGAEQLAEVLPQILAKTAQKTEQDHDQATFTTRLTKQSGIIDWSKTAADIERAIRAYADWPSSTTVLGSVECTITKARVYEDDRRLDPGEIHTTKDYLVVGCGNNSCLEIQALKPINKQEMSADAFLRGYGSKL